MQLDQVQSVRKFSLKRYKLLRNSNRLVIVFSILFPFYVLSLLLGLSVLSIFSTLPAILFEQSFKRGKPRWLEGFNPYLARTPGQLYHRICLLYFVVYFEVACLSTLFLSLSSGTQLETRTHLLPIIVLPMIALSALGLFGWSRLTKEMSIRMARMGLRSGSKQLPKPGHD